MGRRPRAGWGGGGGSELQGREQRRSGAGEGGPEESEGRIGRFFACAAGDRCFSDGYAIAVRDAYHQMPIPFCNRLLESV